ncbi:MAG: hypothetical protein ACYC2K_17390 [Gemmatimonadales bacterium]
MRIHEFASNSADLPGQIASVLTIGLAAAVIIASVIRVVFAMIRRRPNDIKEGVLKPLMKSGSVQSEAFGWKPAAEEMLATGDRIPPREWPEPLTESKEEE